MLADRAAGQFSGFQTLPGQPAFSFYTPQLSVLIPIPIPSLATPPVLQASYRAEEILAQYGSLDAFVAAVAPKQPLAIPDLHFTADENQRMDEILAKDRKSTDESEVRED